MGRKDRISYNRLGAGKDKARTYWTMSRQQWGDCCVIRALPSRSPRMMGCTLIACTILIHSQLHALTSMYIHVHHDIYYGRARMLADHSQYEDLELIQIHSLYYWDP